MRPMLRIATSGWLTIGVVSRPPSLPALVTVNVESRSSPGSSVPARALLASSNGRPTGPVRLGYVILGTAPLRPGPFERLELDDKLLRKPPNERSRPDSSLLVRSEGLSLGHVRNGRLRFGLRLPCSRAVLADYDEHGPNRNDVALGDQDPRDLSGCRRRDLDRRLVGLDLDKRVVLRDLLALAHEPASDLALGEPLPQIRQLELVRHGGLLPNRVVAEHRMRAEHAVHDLRHAQVDRNARQGEGLTSHDAELAAHQGQDPVDGDSHRKA